MNHTENLIQTFELPLNIIKVIGVRTLDTLSHTQKMASQSMNS